jgi:hypothetical protein
VTQTQGKVSAEDQISSVNCRLRAVEGTLTNAGLVDRHQSALEVSCVSQPGENALELESGDRSRQRSFTLAIFLTKTYER